MSHVTIFLDESGCLGYDFTKKSTSKNFIITALITSHKRPLEKIIKNIFSQMNEKERKRHSGTLHAYKEPQKNKIKLLEKLKENKEVKIMILKLNKQKVYVQLQNNETVLYNYITNILLDRIISKHLLPENNSINFIASQRETNKRLNDNFKKYLKKKSSGKLDLKVHIETSSKEKCLQIVDCISWAVFRKCEHGDDTYYKIFKKLIIEEKELYK